MLIRLHARAVLRVHGFYYCVTFLEYFAIETDALISYDSGHYQDYSVNRAPIHRAFRAQAGASEPSLFGTSSSFSSPVETDSRLHDQDVSMVAGHDSATLDEGPGGDIGGHVTSMPFSPLVDALQSTWISATRGGRTAVSDARLLRRRRLQGPARHHRAQPAHPPRRHDAPTHETHVVRTRRARASSPSGTRMWGRTCCGTSSLRPGTPTVLIVRISGPHHLPAHLCTPSPTLLV